MVKYTKYYFLEEDAEASYNAEVNVDRIEIITDFIPLPEALNFLKRVYIMVLYRVCQYINDYLCTVYQKHLPPHDTHHGTATELCSKVTHTEI